MAKGLQTNAPPLIEAGKEAMRRGQWNEARTHLEASLAEGETAEALEQLGLVAWWLDDATVTFDARERAYRLYREHDDPQGAARVALWLVWDNLAFRGDTAVASGWLERARRLLTGHEKSPEYGWLLLREGEVALFRGHDPAGAREKGISAAELGRSIGDLDLEFTGLALEGLAMVSGGEVASGIRRLDEATAAATAGEVKQMHTVGVVCCWQIFACERVRDYERAAQWCTRVQEFTKRWSIRPLSAICSTQYAGVLIWRGAWDEAEAILVNATNELQQVRPALIVQSLARLGELRLRQGRLDEAAQLFDRSGAQLIARLGQVALSLELNRPDDAVAQLDRFLAQVSEGEPTTRAGALELAVRAHVTRGDAAAARTALTELNGVAQQLGTTPLAASAQCAHGLVLQLEGNHSAAIECFEKAAELYGQSVAPFEAARARVYLARALAASGDRRAAEREARGAVDGFSTLGAAHDLSAATQLLQQLAGTERPQKRTAELTGRQLEILRLVAQGLSNPDIASRLGLSDHTIKRHVANLLTKLGLPSRSAAVAYAARKNLL